MESKYSINEDNNIKEDISDNSYESIKDEISDTSENQEGSFIGELNVEEIKNLEYELYSNKEAPLLETDNYLAEPVDTKYKNITPLQLLHEILDDYFPKIEEYSKIYANKKYNTDFTININDFYSYILVYLYLSIYNLPEVEMIWNKNPLFQTIIPVVISRDKYRNINKFFYISKYNGISTPIINENNKTDKIDEFISYITKKWKST